MKRLQILDIGCGPEPTAPFVFQPIIDQGYEYDLTTIDINPENNPTYVLDIREPFPDELIGKFDLVMASHILEHVERTKAIITFLNFVNTVAPGGELWIIVPSLEWCAEEIRNNRFGMGVLACIYGDGSSGEMAHYTGYTLVVLRELLRKSGMIVRKAYQSKFNINQTNPDGETRVIEAMQNIVIGVKPGESNEEAKDDSTISSTQ